MAHSPFALFVVSDKITIDDLNRVLTDEASYGVYVIAPVVEPDLSSPYSASPRRLYNSAGKEVTPAEHPPPVSADLLTPANNPFIGATLDFCGTYLRASASVDVAWDTDIFAVLDEQYLTHGTILVAHSYVPTDESRYYPLPIKCYRTGVQAYPSEKGLVCGHMSLRTGLDFQEELERYQRVCKSSGVEDRSVGRAWELFQPTEEENATSV